VHSDIYCVFTNRTPATAMRGFGVTAMDFAIECQMDKLAHLIGMNPMEFRIVNAYRDGDMKAHRREAKNTALIECAQVAAEKAKWPIRDEFKRMSSRRDGGGSRAVVPPTPGEPRTQSVATAQQRTTYDRGLAVAREPGSAPASAGAQGLAPPPSPASPRPAPQHGATRFSSVFGTRRR
jgi:CO/xanthine dehydrogenase Mo-binding subunit